MEHYFRLEPYNLFSRAQQAQQVEKKEYKK